MRRIALALAALAAAAVAASPAGAEGSAAKVSVRLFEFKVVPSPATARRGLVVFAVRNTGKLAHELVVLKTSLPPAKLKVKGAKAVETGRVGRVGPLAPGAARTLRLTLAPGKYVLLCNVPGHYQAGQRTGFAVT